MIAWVQVDENRARVRVTFGPSGALGNSRCWLMRVPRKRRPIDVWNVRNAVVLRGQGETIMIRPKYVRFFDEFGIEDVPAVGGKDRSLGEMFQKLSDQGVRVPDGFAITADAYRYVLQESGAVAALHEALDDLVPSDVT